MNIKRLLIYILVGAAGTAVQYGTLIGLVRSGQISAPLASCVGAILGAGVNYLLNHRITFRSTRSHAAAASRFFTVAAGGIGANWALMTVLSGWLGVYYIVAQLLTTAVVLALTYSANAAWSFRTEPNAV